MPKINAFLICDEVLSENNKKVIRGIFDTIYTKRLPITHPYFAIYLHMDIPKENEKGYKYKIEIKKEEEVIYSTDFFSVYTNKPRNQITHWVVKLTFKEEGRYDIYFYIKWLNGEENTIKNYFFVKIINKHGK